MWLKIQLKIVASILYVSFLSSCLKELKEEY